MLFLLLACLHIARTTRTSNTTASQLDLHHAAPLVTSQCVVPRKLHILLSRAWCGHHMQDNGGAIENNDGDLKLDSCVLEGNAAAV